MAGGQRRNESFSYSYDRLETGITTIHSKRRYLCEPCRTNISEWYHIQNKKILPILPLKFPHTVNCIFHYMVKPDVVSRQHIINRRKNESGAG